MTKKIVLVGIGVVVGVLLTSMFFHYRYTLCSKETKNLDDALNSLSKDEAVKLLKDMGVFTEEMAGYGIEQLKTVLKQKIEANK